MWDYHVRYALAKAAAQRIVFLLRLRKQSQHAAIRSLLEPRGYFVC
jgi:hypothetical protein